MKFQKKAHRAKAKKRQQAIKKQELVNRIRILSKDIVERYKLSLILHIFLSPVFFISLVHCSSGKKHKKLSLIERQQIYCWRGLGMGIREIARRLRRAASTISRELKRNKAHVRFLGADSYFRARQAHEMARERRRKSRRRDRLRSWFLQTIVYKAIESGISPKLLSNRLFIEYGIRLSHEAIYNWIYDVEKALIERLPRKGKAYRRGGKKRSRSKRPQHSSKLSIEQRSKAANQRLEFGHWEVDCIVSRQSKSCLLVLQERVSRYFFAVKLPSCSAEEVNRAMIRLLKPLDRDWVKSITCDNGSEFWGYDEIMQELQLPVYFCHPYCSSERGGVENRNGMLRWFFPKKTDFELISDEEVESVRNIFVNRPMECLDYFTPLEIFTGEFKPLLGIAA